MGQRCGAERSRGAALWGRAVGQRYGAALWGRAEPWGSSAPPGAPQERLQRCVEPLEQRLLALRHCQEQEDRKPAELKRSACSLRRRIAAEFAELRRALSAEEAELQRRVDDEEADIAQRLRRNAAALRQRRAHLLRLLRDAQRGGTDRGRPDLPALLSSCEEEAARSDPPPSVPIALQKNFRSFPRQYFTLRKMARCLLGDVTLDPSTAHPNLLLSRDLKSVRYTERRRPHLPPSARRFTAYPCVLASRAITSGRHYWEVEVGRKTHWALGVCGDSVRRDGEPTELPHGGFWRVRLWNGDRYAATTAPFTPISPRVPPTRVGVFVDYEAGEVSFYNVTDRSHLYTFTETFTEKIWPLFYPGIRAGRRNAAPLSICEPTDWE